MVIKKTFIKYLFISLVTFIVSCKGGKLENDNKDLKIGDLFVFPDTIEFIEKGFFYQESSMEFMSKYKDSPTILSIIWGDCHVCTKKLLQWSGNISKKEFGENTKFIFIISASDNFFFKNLL